MFTTYNPIHNVHIDSLDRLIYVDNRQLMHLVHQYIMNCKFSNIHHVLFVPDETDPENKKQL